MIRCPHCRRTFVAKRVLTPAQKSAHAARQRKYREHKKEIRGLAPVYLDPAKPMIVPNYLVTWNQATKLFPRRSK